MGRRKKGQPIDGWLAVDKPVGMTSTAVVATVRRLLDAQKVGHGGTLDPLASGILPIAFGEATKTVSYVMDGRKTYALTVRWGEERSTDDREGEVTDTSDVRPTPEQIEAALPAFVGEIQQVPPRFSAVKVAGRRAYDMARKDEDVELSPRPILIKEFTLLECPDADHAVFRVVSGKGAYMRSLARDLARALGTVGHVAALRRTACGPFNEDGAISLDKLEALGHSAASSDTLLPVSTALDDIPALALTEVEANRLSHGQPIPVLPVVRRSSVQGVIAGTTVRAMEGDRLVALARIEGGEVRPVRVINLKK
ncbi:tRNA pseudouridine synthase B [Caenispirillum salinarum AK4]|uniref:tRNA pseudouridine synthase B n=1 Tax=Caenispirillum salinarum AK4 TaxID=1238182 RepID=K9HP99_9PROT|nr:tRNA pseudouridine(55) synthase TruB [Caenispirillum salinarum]EKV32103.1 tRNA pseudouridine synthase B [Caenispirillum salinarum AK4]